MTLRTSIDDAGWEYRLVAPPFEGDEREARLDHLRALFAAFAPVVRPLVVQVEYGWRETDTAMASKSQVTAPYRLVAEASLPPHVKAIPTMAVEPPVEPVPRLDPDVLRAVAASRRGEQPGESLDWFGVRTLAVAVRADESVNELSMPELGSPVPAFEPGWFAGPSCAWSASYGAIPPATIEARTDYGYVELALTVHWKPWAEAKQPGYEGIRAALAELRAQGWTKPEAFVPTLSV